MRNKEQKRDLSVQAIAGPSAVGMISTKLFPDGMRGCTRNAGISSSTADKNAPLDELMSDCVRWLDIPPEPIPAGRAFLEIAGINDYSIFPDLERLKNDIHRCNRIGVEDTHTKPQPGTLRQGAH
jgi:hypothetical protein